MAAARSAAASSSQPLLSADSSLLAASEFDPTALDPAALYFGLKNAAKAAFAALPQIT